MKTEYANSSDSVAHPRTREGRVVSNRNQYADDPYSQWMYDCYQQLKAVTFCYDLCDKCGGTGVHAVQCCNGYECGCMGMPVDFEACPNGCNPPDWWRRGGDRA